jgi:regulator of RNase E activity RraB
VSKDWDFFTCRVDDQPASILVDLALAREAPVSRLPLMAHVTVEMNAPRPDGFSSKEEADTLAAIEDALDGALCADESAVYVGRCTSAGRRDFFYYAAVGAGWEERVAKAMEPFPAYDFDSGARPDAEWMTYREFLYPSPMDHHRIMNRRVCFQLEKAGDALQKEREIDHFAYFPTAETRASFVARAKDLGFEWRDSGDSEKPGDKFAAHLVRADVPSFANIDAVTLPLFELAQEMGGNYDGWGCNVIS